METLNELDKLSAELLQKMPEILEKGMQYGSDLYIRFIRYAFIKESFVLVLSLIFVYIIYKIRKIIKKHETENETIWTGENEFCFWLLAGIPTIMLAVIIYECLINIALLATVPELYIINYFK